MSITEFLLARIAEDEEEAQWKSVWVDGCGMIPDDKHALAECVAKRQIIAEHREGRFFTVTSGCRVCRTSNADPDQFPCRTLRHLAAIYSKHPDYQEWTIC